MRTSLVFASAAFALALVTPRLAHAVDVPGSITDRPSGAGTAETSARWFPPVREGVEAQVQMGTGFSETYGLGLGARAGYTFRQGLYLGGNVDYFFGHSSNDETAHATIVAGDVGWKIFPRAEWEIRPHLVAGPAVIKTVNNVPFYTDTKTAFAVEPGVMGAYHFGSAFLSADARWFITPSPNTLSLTVGGGIGF
jgi:hypothetical protein